MSDGSNIVWTDGHALRPWLSHTAHILGPQTWCGPPNEYDPLRRPWEQIFWTRHITWKCCTPSVCLSVTCLRFSRNRKAVETSNLVETQAHGQEWKRKCKSGFRRISLLKVNEFTTNQDSRPKWSIVHTIHVSSYTFHQRKCSIFLIICIICKCVIRNGRMSQAWAGPRG